MSIEKLYFISQIIVAVGFVISLNFCRFSDPPQYSVTASIDGRRKVASK